jgi:hypothetical protein
MNKVIFEQNEVLEPVLEDFKPITNEFRINTTNESERVAQDNRESVKESTRNISEIWY